MLTLLCEICNLQCAENKELQEKVNTLEQRLASVSGDKLSLSSEQCISEEYAEELKKKVQSQVINKIFLLLDHHNCCIWLVLIVF